MGKKRNKQVKPATTQAIEMMPTSEFFSEAVIAEDDRFIRGVIIMGRPESKNGYSFSEKARQAIVAKGEGTALMCRGFAHFKGASFGGTLRNWRCNGERIQADLELTDREDVASEIRSIARQKPKNIGNSIVYNRTMNKDESIVEDVDYLHCTDIVEGAATSDVFKESYLAGFEDISGETENKENNNMTDFEELYEQKVAEMAQLQTKIDEGTETIGKLQAALDAEKAKVETYETAEKLHKFKAEVDSALAESQLDDKAISDAWKERLYRCESIEDVSAIIAERKETFGKIFSEAGQRIAHSEPLGKEAEDKDPRQLAQEAWDALHPAE